MLVAFGKGAEVAPSMIEILERKLPVYRSEAEIDGARRGAIEVLGMVGPPAKGALPLLRAEARHGARRVRVAAAKALAAFGETEDAIRTLREALNDPSPTTRQDAAAALQRLDPDYVNPYASP
jgi:HEAT repeat protein